MIKPMLAVPMHKGTIDDWSEWVVEEKYDGHRLVVRVSQTPNMKPVEAWTRPRNRAGFPSKEMALRQLPNHLVKALQQLSVGIYDGELVGGRTSTDVTRLDLQRELQFVVFDLLELNGERVTDRSFIDRRSLLERMPFGGDVHLTHCRPAVSKANVMTFVQRVWARGGEGAILKRRRSTYQVGKRSVDWIKVKKLQSTVMTVIGFEPSRGTVRFPGHPFAIVKLRDEAGHETTVKTKDDHELAQFEAQGKRHTEAMCRSSLQKSDEHPALGRKLLVEYQDRTPDGGYRHPRWDRWEDE